MIHNKILVGIREISWLYGDIWQLKRHKETFKEIIIHNEILETLGTLGDIMQYFYMIGRRN